MCRVVVAIVARYARTPLVMKTVLQTLVNCVYEHDQLLEPFRNACVALSARELHAVVMCDEPDGRCVCVCVYYKCVRACVCARVCVII